MRRTMLSWARPVAGALVVLLMLAWAAPRAAAAEVKAAAGKAPLSASVAAKVAALKPAPRAFQAQTPPTQTTPDDRGSFLRSTTGRIALVVMAAGLGYAVYSAYKDNDPVHSPIR